MSDADLLKEMGTDGAKWAEEFMKNFKDNYPDVPLDEGWMITWFANAIEAGRSAGYVKGCLEVDEKRNYLKEVLSS